MTIRTRGGFSLISVRFYFSCFFPFFSDKVRESMRYHPHFLHIYPSWQRSAINGFFYIFFFWFSSSSRCTNKWDGLYEEGGLEGGLDGLVVSRRDGRGYRSAHPNDKTDDSVVFFVNWEGKCLDFFIFPLAFLISYSGVLFFFFFFFSFWLQTRDHVGYV
ncbi:hypothetical protein SODALDRAFT_170236 [Sodiomyces alkalinus F11]|uniref:Uncharacterized protein n=1 Tax=Sodiomyces alkalinus (strain CBS 110278 / VKM F-3762 / F11) TaxID=1314773 RepID=A0A3N2PW63_SODAK|nr:hypothetical protein SODALDRAFT_170236 [Sodiomyces alkalinus F11]ROT38749.1 hypothetical protein SODALDRAFT_170236 [Sodiomyces alkalinus F11]